MKTLAHHTLVYDQECPMCDLYTKTFVETGMLDVNGRVAYGCARVPAGFDNQRAKDEIALVDFKTGSVIYGVDSLLTVVGHSFPTLKRIFGNKFLKGCLAILYKFISYNRKVIAPPRDFERRGSCTPSYHLGYRLAYLVFAWLLTSWVLTAYAGHIPMLPPSRFGREFLICGGQILFQWAMIRVTHPKMAIHYLGNMMTVSLIGSLLLLPILIAKSLFVSISSWVFFGWFAMVVAFMLMIHIRRVRKLGLHWTLSFTWVIYRILILWIILL